MTKCLGVSKNLFLTLEHVLQLLSQRRNMIHYLPDPMWRSCVLHTFLSAFLLIEDSRKPRLSCIFKSQKPILRLGIDSLRPQNTFPYPGYNSRTIRTTLKNHSKSSPSFLLYLPSEKLQKGLNRVIFGLVFCDFLDSGSWYQKSLLGTKQPPKVLQKTLLLFWDCSHNFRKNRKKHQKK